MIRGIRAHDVGAQGIENIVRRCRELDISCIQLVLAKSIKDFSYGKFSPEYAEKLKKLLEGIDIAVLGSYINPSCSDLNSLFNQMEYFKEQLKYAKILGASVVGTETGFYGPSDSCKLNNTEEAYAHLLKNMKELVGEAEKLGVNVGIEGVHCFVINSPGKMFRFVNDLNSQRVKVIFDPVNYLNENNYKEQDDIINETFSLLGDRIAAVHAKDFLIENGKLISALPGTGMLNYKLLMKNIYKYIPDVPIILEGVPDSDAQKAFDNIKNNTV